MGGKSVKIYARLDVPFIDFWFFVLIYGPSSVHLKFSCQVRWLFNCCLNLIRCPLFGCFYICPEIIKILSIMSHKDPCFLLTWEVSIRAWSRKSFISLGKVVSFLFSDQNDLCDLPPFPLCLVCQEDYKWSFHSITTTWFIVIF